MLTSDRQTRGKRADDAERLSSLSEPPPRSAEPPRESASTSLEPRLNWIPFVASIAMLLMASADQWPLAFYELLRIVVTVTAVYAAAQTLKHRQHWPWVMGGIAILFNPVFPISFKRSEWQQIDFGVAVVLLIALIQTSLTRADRRSREVFMLKVTDFLFVAGKAVVAVALAGILLSGAFWGYSAWAKNREAQKRLPLAVMKNWPGLTFVGNATGVVKTAWRDGRLYYQLDISDYPFGRFVEREGATLTLEFRDQDGFELFEEVVVFNAMTHMLRGGEPSGLSWSDSRYRDPDPYSRVAMVRLIWHGFTEEKPAALAAPPAKPRDSWPARAIPSDEWVDVPSEPPPSLTTDATASWRSPRSWRELVYGMDEIAVRELLGEPTKINRGARLVDWQYGDVDGGGTVSFGGAGVAGWRAPTSP